MPPWSPQPGPQLAAIEASRFVQDLLFGGARGGGKTDFLIGDWIQDAPQGSNWRGILFRQTYRELEDHIIPRCQELIPASFSGARYLSSTHTWTVPSGATLRLRYLESEADADTYMGQAYPWLGIDEIGNWPSEAPVKKLSATLRAPGPVSGIRMRVTANPGGVGHGWVKARYVDPHPGGGHVFRDPKSGMTRMYIPAKVTDNKIFLASDPGYVERLRDVGSAALVKAWLDGDWNVVEGAYFDCWSSERHIIAPIALPEHWTRITGFDWGSARPYGVVWAAVSDGAGLADGTWFPRGALVIYRELYGASGPNIGLHGTAEDCADAIKLLEHEKVNYRVADPACWKEDGGPSIAERMGKRGIVMRRADNSRVAGWDQIRGRLIGEVDPHSDIRFPALYVFSNCPNLIRTLPALQHDKLKPEDVDSDGDDHLPDALRYLCMSRPYARMPVTGNPMRGLLPMNGQTGMTMDEAWKLATPLKVGERI